ncbi:hypothetical protein GCM10017673_43890 [Streptosporangium violaceochromogenes]|nr:hypothetical protein GCM10017673_43890 [Streptosporangium violaceochromogenes]
MDKGIGLLGPFVLFGFWAALIYGLVRFIRWILNLSRHSRFQVHDAPPDPTWNSRPNPGQIWWALVPFSDMPGGKVRPCLVVRTHRQSVEVLKITSQDKSHQINCVSIPTARWDPRARKDSWLDLEDTYFIHDGDFRRRAGVCDDGTWSTVTHLYWTGWVY